MNDKELMNRVATGDSSAVREVVEQYSELVFRTCYRILCDRKDAEAVTEAVFRHIVSNASRYDEDLPLKLWILRHVCRKARFRITRRRLMYIFGVRPDVYFTSAPKVADHDDYITHQAWEIYCRAAMKLNPMQMIVYSLSVLEQLSDEDVYRITGIPDFKVRRDLNKANEKVKSELRRYGKVR